MKKRNKHGILHLEVILIFVCPSLDLWIFPITAGIRKLLFQYLHYIQRPSNLVHSRTSYSLNDLLRFFGDVFIRFSYHLCLIQLFLLN